MLSGETYTDYTLVLDLDSCLVESFFNISDPDIEGIDPSVAMKWIMSKFDNQSLRRRFYSISDVPECEGFCGLRREGLDRFLSFAFGYFKYVIVWSAGSKRYVHSIVKEIFKGHHQPHYILTHDDVVHTTKDDYYKPLSVIDKLYPGTVPRHKTIFVDDKADNFREDVGNGFVIPMCNISLQNGEIVVKTDNALLGLMNWLSRKEVLKATDISKLDKKNAFTYNGRDTVVAYTPRKYHVFFYSPMAHV